MQDFFDWFARSIRPEDPWLIFGKGPSFALRDRFDLEGFRTLSLNHSMREQPVLVAHAIDLDVVEACADVVGLNARCLVVPWVPHVRNRPGRSSLPELLSKVPVLAELSAQDRLLWYNLSTTKVRNGNSPVVRATYFSAEAAVSLLAQAGAQRVRSLGIDGGVTYSGEFNDLKGKTLLNNGHPNFDLQFKGIARTIMTTGVDYAPLHEESPIRVYVGSQEAQMLAVKVLEYSIRKYTSATVEVFPLHDAGIEVPMPKDEANRPRTPFSFQRFFIPALAGYQGRAIYLDSDMQVFEDIRGLWTLPFDGADLLAAREPGETGRRPQFSVMLLNCDELKWDVVEIVNALDRGDLTYETLMYDMAVADDIRAAIDPRWNSLERYEEGKTALLHYTDMHKQPWISRENPLGYLWVRDLIEAVDAGFITREYVQEHVEQEYVRPSLLYQVDNRMEESLILPKAARALDRDFVPPYRKMDPHGGARGRNPLTVLRAGARYFYHKSPLRKVGNLIRRYT